MDSVLPLPEAGEVDLSFLIDPSFEENPRSPKLPYRQGNIMDLGEDVSASTPGGIPVYDGTRAQSEPTTTTSPGFETSQVDFTIPSEYPSAMCSENFPADQGLQYPVYDDVTTIAEAWEEVGSSWLEWSRTNAPYQPPQPDTNWTPPDLSEDGVRGGPVVLEHPGNAVPSLLLLPSPPISGSPTARPSTNTSAPRRPGRKSSGSSEKTCETCQKVLADASALSKHKKTHKEAAFACPYCKQDGKTGRVFNRTDNYKRHVRKEAGKKPACEGLREKDGRNEVVWVNAGNLVDNQGGEVPYEIPSDFKSELQRVHKGRHGQDGRGRPRNAH